MEHTALCFAFLHKALRACGSSSEKSGHLHVVGTMTPHTTYVCKHTKRLLLAFDFVEQLQAMLADVMNMSSEMIMCKSSVGCTFQLVPSFNPSPPPQSSGPQ